MWFLYVFCEVYVKDLVTKNERNKKTHARSKNAKHGIIITWQRRRVERATAKRTPGEAISVTNLVLH